MFYLHMSVFTIEIDAKMYNGINGAYAGVIFSRLKYKRISKIIAMRDTPCSHSRLKRVN